MPVPAPVTTAVLLCVLMVHCSSGNWPRPLARSGGDDSGHEQRELAELREIFVDALRHSRLLPPGQRVRHHRSEVAARTAAVQEREQTQCILVAELHRLMLKIGDRSPAPGLPAREGTRLRTIAFDCDAGRR